MGRQDVTKRETPYGRRGCNCSGTRARRSPRGHQLAKRLTPSHGHPCGRARDYRHRAEVPSAQEQPGRRAWLHNPVFNAADTRQIATDNGYCIRTVATGMTEWECTWTTLLPAGHITVEGPFFDNGTNTTLAITGGTGRYTGAEGSMLLHATGHPAGSEFDFIFTLTH